MSKRNRYEWIFGTSDIPERTKRCYSHDTVAVKESHPCGIDGSNLISAQEACNSSAIESGKNNCGQHESGDSKCSSDVDSCTNFIADAGVDGGISCDEC